MWLTSVSISGWPTCSQLACQPREFTSAVSRHYVTSLLAPQLCCAALSGVTGPLKRIRTQSGECGICPPSRFAGNLRTTCSHRSETMRWIIDCCCEESKKIKWPVRQSMLSSQMLTMEAVELASPTTLDKHAVLFRPPPRQLEPLPPQKPNALSLLKIAFIHGRFHKPLYSLPRPLHAVPALSSNLILCGFGVGECSASQKLLRPTLSLSFSRFFSFLHSPSSFSPLRSFAPFLRIGRSRF